MSQFEFGSRTRSLLTVAVAVCALLVVGVAGAQAKVVKLTGSTTVTPSAAATQFLASQGVTVAPIAPATAGSGAFTFPLRTGFGNPKNYNGVLVHKGGLKFSKGTHSAVVRGFVAVRHGKRAVLLAKVPGLKGGCKAFRKQIRRFGKRHKAFRKKAGKRIRRQARKHPKAMRRTLRALRGYCKGGRVIKLAKLQNLTQSTSGSTVTLSADLHLSKRAAKLLNKRFGTTIPAGVVLGSATSTVTPAK
jgi:hypothetical protein